MAIKPGDKIITHDITKYKILRSYKDNVLKSWRKYIRRSNFDPEKSNKKLH